MSEGTTYEAIDDDHSDEVEGHILRLGPVGAAGSLGAKGAEESEEDEVEGHILRLGALDKNRQQ